MATIDLEVLLLYDYSLHELSDNGRSIRLWNATWIRCGGITQPVCTLETFALAWAKGSHTLPCLILGDRGWTRKTARQNTTNKAEIG